MIMSQSDKQENLEKEKMVFIVRHEHVS